jgi:hypothetical protein
LDVVRRWPWVVLASLALLLTALPGPWARGEQSHPRVCVHNGGCYPSLAAAVAHAASGATVELPPGVFRGGLKITRSVRLVGAGEDRTDIHGGGPVITVTGSPQVTVSLRNLSITGGVTRSYREGGERESFQAFGGGLLVAPVSHPDAEETVGATVRLSHVRVMGNRATPTTTSPSPSGVKCPHGDCPFARAAGGGIANYGTLSLDHTTVSGNTVGSHVSDANGGGVFSALGDLEIGSSVVADNRAVAKGIGRYAEGGGAFVESGGLDVHHSWIVSNRATLVTRLPVHAQGTVIDMNANSGAIHIGDGSQVHISHARLSGNSISAIDPRGEPLAFDAAMLVGDSHLQMDHTVVTHNRVRVDVATAEDVGSSGTALELDGPGMVTDSLVADNPVRTYSRNGQSIATGGVGVYDFAGNPRQVTFRRVRVVGNVATARSSHGSALVKGAGVVNNSLLDLHHVLVAHNVGIARGPSATAQGGGVWNGVDLSGPPVVLRAWDSRIVWNSLTASHGGTRQGGGLFTTAPVTLRHTVIEHNKPDDCVGC